MALQFRVGKVGGTQKATEWVDGEFGINPTMLGSLTPQIVEELNVDAAKMARQVQMGKMFMKHAQSIMDGKYKIEEMRVDLIRMGLARKEDVDDLVNKTITLTNKHQGHIALMLQEMLQGTQMSAAQSYSALEVSEHGFKNALREIRARHRAKIQTQDTKSKERIRTIEEEQQIEDSEARNEQERARAFAQVLSGGQRAKEARYDLGSGRANSIFGGNASRQAQPFGKSTKSGRRSWLSKFFGIR